MAALLFGPVECHQGGTGDQAAVALGKAGSLPDITEQHIVGQLDQLGRKGAELVAWIGSRLGHLSNLLGQGLA